ncbi:unnamed protein product [Gadus morhua 'NCC']
MLGDGGPGSGGISSSPPGAAGPPASLSTFLRVVTPQAQGHCVKQQQHTRRGRGLHSFHRDLCGPASLFT